MGRGSVFARTDHFLAYRVSLSSGSTSIWGALWQKPSKRDPHDMVPHALEASPSQWLGTRQQMVASPPPFFHLQLHQTHYRSPIQGMGRSDCNHRSA